jgi:excisionase family DNA binding protein
MTIQPLLSQKAAGERLGVCRTTIWKMVKSGQIPSVLIGKRRLIDPRDLEDLIQNSKTRGKPE